MKVNVWQTHDCSCPAYKLLWQQCYAYRQARCCQLRREVGVLDDRCQVMNSAAEPRRGHPPARRSVAAMSQRHCWAAPETDAQRRQLLRSDSDGRPVLLSVRPRRASVCWRTHPVYHDDDIYSAG